MVNDDAPLVNCENVKKISTTTANEVQTGRLVKPDIGNPTDKTTGPGESEIGKNKSENLIFKSTTGKPLAHHYKSSTG